MSRRIFSGILFWACALVLEACSASSTPQRIAAYPRSPNMLLPAPGSQEIVYNAFLVLEVVNPEWAAGQASSLAYQHGGCQVSSQSWERDGIRYAIQVLCVPSYRFSEFRNELVRLGRVIDEHSSGALVDPFSESGQVYSQVTVQFQTSPQYIIEPFIPGWNPALTLKKAFSVFLNVFGFLADISIWLLVVIGPFALLSWAAWRIARRKSAPKG